MVMDKLNGQQPPAEYPELTSFTALIAEHGIRKVFRTAFGASLGLWLFLSRMPALRTELCAGCQILTTL